MARGNWEPELVAEIAAQFAAGATIGNIAEWAGCAEWEIELVLKENAAAMQAAFDRTEPLGGTKTGHKGTKGIEGASGIANALRRIAVAMEKIAEELRDGKH